MDRTVLAVSMASTSLLLSACGGGGGGGVQPISPPPTSIAPPPPAPAPTPPPPPPTTGNKNFDTSEYRTSNAAVTSGAIAAYNLGATGKGVKLAVIDSGINPALPEFAGRIDPASRDVASTRPLADESGHGSAVTATAAAAKDDVWMHGVAPEATILALRADTPGSCTQTTGEDPGCKFGDTAIARGVDAAVAAGARVINLSLGGSAPGNNLLLALQRAVGAGAVIVIAAGNDGEDPAKGATADAFGAIPAANFPSHVIVAGSVGRLDPSTQIVGSLDTISDFSNRAGSSQNNVLMALGAGVRTVDEAGGRYLYSGTSFAAPTITGAAALLAQLFPNLSGAQIVDILFKSADDLGAPGTDAIYGRGRLNIGRAVQPIGATSMAGSAVPVTGSNAEAPPAAGDATNKGQKLGAIILDGYSRAFAVDLARTIRTAPQAQPLRRALEGHSRVGGASAGSLNIAMTVAERKDLPLGYALSRTGIGPEDLRQARLVAGSAVAQLDRKTAMAFGFAEGAKALERRLSGAEAGAFLIARDVAGNPGFDVRRGGSLAIRRNLGPAAVTIAGETGEVWTDIRTSATGSPYRWTAITADRRLGRTWLSAGIGRLEERGTVLGGRMGAAFGSGGAGTTFLDLEARRELGAGISAGLNVRRGWTRFPGGGFTSGAYGLDLAKTGLLRTDDRLGLRLAQPLRIDSGGFAMTLPTGFNYDTMSPSYSLVRSGLTPAGRELTAELSYGTRLLGTGWLGANLYGRRQPGHIAAAPADIGGAIRFTLGF